LPRGEYRHEMDSKNLPGDDGLRTLSLSRDLKEPAGIQVDVRSTDSNSVGKIGLTPKLSNPKHDIEERPQGGNVSSREAQLPGLLMIRVKTSQPMKPTSTSSLNWRRLPSFYH
jgi:hypothetical protein